jgi:uncharacterized protein YggE
MPGFTQEPYREPKLINLPKIKSSTIITILVCLFALYVIYYFAPNKITSSIPNPLGRRSLITVIGTGTIKATPDRAKFAVTVAELGSTSNDALTKAKNRVTQLSNSLKAKGLVDQDIQTSSYNVTPTQDSNNQLIYAAGTTMVISTPDLFSAEDLVNTALAQGARLTVPLTYTIEKRDVLEQQARKEAISNAQTKAENIAKTYNKHLGKMLSYTENPSTQGALTSETPQRLNEIEITQTIQVTFQTK